MRLGRVKLFVATPCRPQQLARGSPPAATLEALRRANLEKSLKGTRQAQRVSKSILDSYFSKTGFVDSLQVSYGQQLAGRHTFEASSKQFSFVADGAGANENGIYFCLQFILSAEALHKERMAFDSIIEPWRCVVKAQYVRCVCIHSSPT